MHTHRIVVHPSTLALARAEPAWLDRDLYPFSPHFVDLDGHRLHYVDEGAGPPILFVHGTPSWSFEWRRVIETVCDAHRCVAPDHLGFGLSDKPEQAPYRPENHARRLLDFVRQLDLRDVTLVVHDFGGPIGAWVALAEPWRFRSIVVMNTWMWGLADDPRVARLSRFLASPLGRFLYRWLNASPRWLLPATFADKKKLSPEIHDHYKAPFRSRRERTAPWVLGCELAASHAFYQKLWQSRHELPRVSTIIWGMADPAFDASQLERWRSAWPDANVVSIDDTGHFPQEEAPDVVARAIRHA